MNREDVINAFREKNRDLAVSNAKGKARSKLEGMSDAEKQILTGLKQLVDRSSVEKIYEMLQILSISEK